MNTDAIANISQKLPYPVKTSDAKQDSFASSMEQEETFRARLSEFRERLKEWALHPDEFEAEGMEPPARTTLALAASVAEVLLRKELSAHANIVPDTSGGIVIELREGDAYESYRVNPNGRLDYCLFQNAKLVARQQKA